MSKSDAFEAALLGLVFNGTAISGLADNAAAPAANLYLALHTADPGDGGDQATSECAYGGYARVAVARDGAGFVVTGNSVSPAEDQDFPVCASGSEVATHWSVGRDATGGGLRLYSTALDAAVTITASPAVTPRLLASSVITED